MYQEPTGRPPAESPRTGRPAGWRALHTPGRRPVCSNALLGGGPPTNYLPPPRPASWKGSSPHPRSPGLSKLGLSPSRRTSAARSPKRACGSQPRPSADVRLGPASAAPRRPRLLKTPLAQSLSKSEGEGVDLCPASCLPNRSARPALGVRSCKGAKEGGQRARSLGVPV